MKRQDAIDPLAGRAYHISASKEHAMYTAVTRRIRVTVTPRFVEEESSPDEGRFFFAYTVEITNLNPDRVQLRARHWRIIDGQGHMQEVRGAGVVGKQPVLAPGETFTYTSGCPLTTPDGTMEGVYIMVAADGETFEAAIPAFSLDSPHVKRVMH
jgi:ApaG protein